MRGRDMTEGTIWKQLVLFAVPLLLGNVLQQLYNAFDAFAVGNWAENGDVALAAVGSTGTLINMIIAFFMGMSTGASVLISQSFGARDNKTLHDVLHTAVTLAVIMGVVLSVIGIFFAPWMLEMIGTPESIMPEAVEYMQIFLAGMTALTIYNMGTAILTAVGDSKRPLYFLAVSAALNVIFDIVFVVAFGWGVAGVAWATVIAEVVSAALVVITLCRSGTAYRLILKDLRIHRHVLKRITVIGLPGGIQQAIISLSNLFVQYYINQLGDMTVSGYIAASKLDGFIMLPVATMSLAVTTFVGQNLGAHKVKRARRGTMIATVISLCITAVTVVVMLLVNSTLLRIFSDSPDVIAAGVSFMQVLVPGYPVLAFTQILPGAMRGAGDAKIPTIICVSSFVIVRQIYLYFSTLGGSNITIIGLSYPITWILAAAVLFVYYRKRSWDAYEAKV